MISIPFTWYSANKWLENFAYRISLEWWAFFIAGFAIIFIALLTVGLQAVKAAMANPVKNLRIQ